MEFFFCCCLDAVSSEPDFYLAEVFILADPNG
jgi:hypothetical protein